LRVILAAPGALVQAVRQTAEFVWFIARRFALFHLVLALTIVVLLFEYAATILMIPLSASIGQRAGGVDALWTSIAQSLALDATARTWLWLFLLAMSGRLIVGYVQAVATILLGKRVHRMLSRRIFDHVVEREPMSEIYARSIGHYITLAGDDTFRGGTIIASFMQWLVGFASSLVALGVLLRFSAPLFLAVTLFLAVSGVAVAAILLRTIRLAGRVNALSREASTTFVEVLNNLRSIRALGAGSYVADGYARQIADYVVLLLRLDALKLGVRALPAIVLLLAAAVLLRPGSNIDAGDAQLFATTVIVVRIFAALGQMVAAGSMLLTDIRGVRDIHVLTEHFDRVESPSAATAVQHVQRIELEGIAFGYSARQSVLDGVSLRFERGRSYAIVGPSGSGKSTLADLLLGLVRPRAGRITFDGREQSPATLAGRILLVEQQPKIFSASVRENLLFGTVADDAALWHALECVQMDDTVRQMPAGLDTPLAYLGENLSGGQRQRIGIARALLRRPDVLILDEATSALDAATRDAVQANLGRELGAGIIVYITHDAALSGRVDEVIDLGREVKSS
jgi:ABC-type bacteriocin/lantibiotic exporter with double-glycine peptidase domain